MKTALRRLQELAAIHFTSASRRRIKANEVQKTYKISVCTVCMNRLEQLKGTYLKNLNDGMAYPNVEFILLNYNSKDDLGDWIKDNFSEYIDSGILAYYKTTEPSWFDNCHSRNVAWRLASGEFVTNLDADHFLGRTFLYKINELANKAPRDSIFVRATSIIRGRIALAKEDFENELKGFDESLVGYSPWDRDLYNRALCLGFYAQYFGYGFGSKEECYIDNHPNRILNYECKLHINTSMRLNTIKSFANIIMGNFAPNKNGLWGKARLIKNFSEELNI